MELTPQILLNAYCQGLFPMAEPDSTLYWYAPDPRAVIPLDRFRVSRSLRRILKKKLFEIRFNTAFRDVMVECAASKPGRESTWISAELIDLYTRVHRLGYAHSVEAWADNCLVGGLYGISIGGFFAGESMFSRRTDASKVALAALVEHLREHDFVLLDIQFITDHLKRFGAQEISREEYERQLAKALTIETQFIQ